MSPVAVNHLLGSPFKLFALVMLLASFALPELALACGGVEKSAVVRVKQFVPYAGTSVEHWPADYGLPITSVATFLVPKGTHASLTVLAKGTSDPLVVVRSKGGRFTAEKVVYLDRDELVDYDAEKYEWIHVQAVSYGKSEIRFHGPKRWSRTMTIGVVYPSVWEETDRPPVCARLVAGEVAVVAVNARDRVVLSVPGSVADHWKLDAEAVGFRVVRIEEEPVPHGDAARVRMYLEGNRNPKDGSFEIRCEPDSGSPSTFRVSVKALPTPKCG